MSDFLLIVYSTGRQNSCAGYGKIHLGKLTADEIINLAEHRAELRGEDLFQYSNPKIELVETTEYESKVWGGDFKPSRDWRLGEQLECAIDELNHDGNFTNVFPKEKAEEFIETAEAFGLGDHARKLVRWTYLQ